MISACRQTNREVVKVLTRACADPSLTGLAGGALCGTVATMVHIDGGIDASSTTQRLVRLARRGTALGALPVCAWLVCWTDLATLAAIGIVAVGIHADSGAECLASVLATCLIGCDVENIG